MSAVGRLLTRGEWAIARGLVMRRLAVIFQRFRGVDDREREFLRR